MTREVNLHKGSKKNLHRPPDPLFLTIGRIKTLTYIGAYISYPYGLEQKEEMK